MFCSQCEKEIADNSKICLECGENPSSDSSKISILVDETRDTRKMPILGYQYYTKEERKDPRNKKKRHIWIPPFRSSENYNFQSAILTYFPFLFLVTVIIYRVYF
jgi:hypothetical protein